MCVNMCVFWCFCALEVPLKQERGGGGWWLDLSLQRGDCNVLEENRRWGVDCYSALRELKPWEHELCDMGKKGQCFVFVF